MALYGICHARWAEEKGIEEEERKEKERDLQPRRSAWLRGRVLFPQDPTTLEWGLSSCFTPGSEPGSQTLIFYRKKHRNHSKHLILPGLAMGLPGKAEEEQWYFVAPHIPSPFFPF